MDLPVVSKYQDTDNVHTTYTTQRTTTMTQTDLIAISSSTTREYQLPESLHLHEQEGLLQIVYSDASPWQTIPVELTQTLCLLCIPTPQLVLQSPQLAQSLQSPRMIELNSKPEMKRYSQNLWQMSGAFRIFLSKLLILKQTLVVSDI